MYKVTLLYICQSPSPNRFGNETFSTLEEFEDWLFFQRGLDFPHHDHVLCRYRHDFAFNEPQKENGNYLYSRVLLVTNSRGEIEYSDGTHTQNIKHCSNHFKSWFDKLQKRLDNPTYNFAE